MTTSKQDTIDAICSGVYQWIEASPRESYQMFVQGTEKAVTKWLDEHRDEIVRAITAADSRSCKRIVVNRFVDCIVQRKEMNKFSVVQVARICHQANKAYCESLGDFSQVSWENAPEWQRQSAIQGVEFHMASYRKPEDSHQNWMAVKQAEGWKYGPVKNEELKEHPCMVPFEELSKEQQMKDIIFTYICSSLIFSGL